VFRHGASSEVSHYLSTGDWLLHSLSATPRLYAPAVEVKTAGQWPVCLAFRLPSGAHDNFFLPENCWFLDVGRPLWWEDGSVIYSYDCFCVLPEQSLSGPSTAELTTIFCCLLWHSPNLEAMSPYYIPQKQGGPVTPPGTGFPFCRLLRLTGLPWKYSNQTPHGLYASEVQSIRTSQETEYVSVTTNRLTLWNEIITVYCVNQM
jgi:hypothetical protein